MTNKELLDVLLSQHRLLRSILGKVGLELQKKEPDTNLIVDNLLSFKINLAEHLKLEDGAFYPKVLSSLKEKGQSTKDTEAFIEQMKVLGLEVGDFLGKYNTSEIINYNFESFCKEYSVMTGKILLRVSMEEEGVYMYLS